MWGRNNYEGVNSTEDTCILSERFWISHDKEQRNIWSLDQNFWWNWTLDESREQQQKAWQPGKISKEWKQITLKTEMGVDAKSSRNQNSVATKMSIWDECKIWY